MQITNKGISDLADRVFDRVYYVGLVTNTGDEPRDDEYEDFRLEKNDWTVVLGEKTFRGVSKWLIWEFSNYKGQIVKYFVKNDLGEICYEERFAKPYVIQNKGDFVKIRSRIGIRL